VNLSQHVRVGEGRAALGSALARNLRQVGQHPAAQSALAQRGQVAAALERLDPRLAVATQRRARSR